MLDLTAVVQVHGGGRLVGGYPDGLLIFVGIRLGNGGQGAQTDREGNDGGSEFKDLVLITPSGGAAGMLSGWSGDTK